MWGWSVSRRRASTRRSWNSSWPDLARSVAASSTKRPMIAPSSRRRCRLTCSSRSWASRPSSTSSARSCLERVLAGRPERCGPLALCSGEHLAFAPVPVLVVERSDRFESRSQALAVEPGGERDQFGDGVDLLVVGGDRGGPDPSGECRKRRGVELEWTRIGQTRRGRSRDPSSSGSRRPCGVRPC